MVFLFLFLFFLGGGGGIMSCVSVLPLHVIDTNGKLSLFCRGENRIQTNQETDPATT